MSSRSPKLNSGHTFDWNDLKYFLAVAREGSTIAAARVLGVSQPTVQRRLACLESEIDCRLFEHFPTGYRLTDEGEKLLPCAERVEQEIAAFGRQVGAIEQSLTGTIRITCPEAEIDRLLAPLLQRFRILHPRIQVEFLVTDRTLDLAKGDADIALRGGQPRDPSLIGRKLADVPWLLFASTAYVEKHGRPRRQEDIVQHPMIAFTGPIAQLAPVRWLRSIAPGAIIAGYSSGVLGALSAAKSGAGLALLPALVGAADRDLVCAFRPQPEVSEPFTLLVHADLREVPRIRAFMDFIAAESGFIRSLLRGECLAETV